VRFQRRKKLSAIEAELSEMENKDAVEVVDLDGSLWSEDSGQCKFTIL
jgi:hypothetical protein